jgi:hypothetical protein
MIELCVTMTTKKPKNQSIVYAKCLKILYALDVVMDLLGLINMCHYCRLVEILPNRLLTIVNKDDNSNHGNMDKDLTEKMPIEGVCYLEDRSMVASHSYDTIISLWPLSSEILQSNYCTTNDQDSKKEKIVDNSKKNRGKKRNIPADFFSDL